MLSMVAAADHYCAFGEAPGQACFSHFDFSFRIRGIFADAAVPTERITDISRNEKGPAEIPQDINNSDIFAEAVSYAGITRIRFKGPDRSVSAIMPQHDLGAPLFCLRSHDITVFLSCQGAAEKFLHAAQSARNFRFFRAARPRWRRVCRGERKVRFLS